MANDDQVTQKRVSKLVATVSEDGGDSSTARAKRMQTAIDAAQGDLGAAARKLRADYTGVARDWTGNGGG